MQSTLTVKTSKGSYPITVERGALSRVGSLLKLSRRVLIVTDEGVPASYAACVAAASLSPIVVTLPEGEATKSIASFEKLLYSEGEQFFIDLNTRLKYDTEEKPLSSATSKTLLSLSLSASAAW